MGRNARKPDPGSINNSGENLLQGAKLLSESGLEVELDLKLGNCRAHVFPVLSEANQKKSGSLVSPENVGAQMKARNLLAGDVLNSRPVLGRNLCPLSQPVGDGLLADGRPAHEFRDAIGQGDLASGDLNRPLEGNNVRFLHDHPNYTTSVVTVNNRSRVPKHKGPCTVLYMPAAIKKAELPDRSPEIIRGPDGLTMGERIKACMEAKGRKLGRKYSQRELVTEVNRVAGRRVMVQQGLSLLLHNKRTDSGATAALAVVLEVEALWLAYGMGPKTYLEAALSKTK